MTMDKLQSKKANALHQNVKKAQPPRTQSNTALYAGVLDIRFHSFSDGEVIG